MNPDLPENQRLSDEDVIARESLPSPNRLQLRTYPSLEVPTFMLAGHDTVSMGVAWTLYALARNPEVERRLRTELRQMASDTPTMDEINALTYLDWVVRETLRLYAPVPYIVKEATLDAELPLSKPFIDTSGREVNSIRIRKGQGLFMSITAMNKRKELYGEDACEFRYGHLVMRI